MEIVLLIMEYHRKIIELCFWIFVVTLHPALGHIWQHPFNQVLYQNIKKKWSLKLNICMLHPNIKASLVISLLRLSPKSRSVLTLVLLSPGLSYFQFWKHCFPLCLKMHTYNWNSVAQWLCGRVLDSRSRGQGFELHRRRCIVSLSKTHFS